MKYRGLSIRELHELLVKKEVTPVELAKEAIRLAKETKNNSFEYIMEEEAIAIASSLGEPEADNLLWGIPFAIKDNFSTKDVPTCGSSNILKRYRPLFDATAVEKLVQKKAVPIGKTTLDELAMGGTGTTGHLGKTFNPHDKSQTRLVGGSSCGSASCTAEGIVPFALGSDTGDSVRKPASLAGLVGVKPTWSRISRYGLFPFCPSLDTVAFFTRNVEDSAIVLNALAGHDEHDSTSSTKPVEDYTKSLKEATSYGKIAVIKEIEDAVKDKDVIEAFHKNLDALKAKGFEVEYVHVDNKLLVSLFPTYFVLSCAEATSNNANLDGIKFGPYKQGKTYEEVMMNARTQGFGELIKRRFVFGSFALMSENQNDLYRRAQKNRRRIVDTINAILKDYDGIYVPAAPSIAPRFDDSSDRLSDEYLIADNHLCIANFAGLPSITLPIGIKEGMPFGANLTCKAFDEVNMYRIAEKIEEATGLKDLIAKEDR